MGYLHFLLILSISTAIQSLPFDTSSDSCDGRCGEKYNPNNHCHCNSKCEKFSDCCNDYVGLCRTLSKRVSIEDMLIG
ncbi:hypothetical protein GDO86_004421 [Hymenochirus boettgeri]|uniref:Uridylate-specific endoribonuclease n=1 Tax=Hymenochirus boettgeri TaxID=247094 RepID=A0A8T2KB52_9PIPI|nr:hypothetical protein GDO86_004421 [Hymenochirus boettgeri]